MYSAIDNVQSTSLIVKAKKVEDV